MASAIRAREWSATALGDIASWPSSLHHTARFILGAGTPMAIYWGPELIVLYNDALRQLLGRKHPAALGRHAWEMFPEIWDEIGPRVADVLGGRGTFGAHDQLLPLDRSGRVEEAWFTYCYNPITHDDGGIGGVLLITLESTQRIRALVQASSEVSFTMTPDWGRIRRLRGPGITSELPLHGTNWLDSYVHPDDRAACRSHIQEAIRSKGTFDLTHRALLPDGGVGWIHSRAVPLLNDAGDIREWFGIANDITARRQAEDALRSSEARLAAIFARAAVGLSEIAPDGRFLAANDELCRIVGRTREQVVGQSITDVTHPDDIPRSLEGASHVLKTGEQMPLDKRYVRPDGSVVWANSTISRLGDDAGSNLLAVTVDLTKRRAAEEAVRRSEERLRSAFQIRTVGVLFWGPDFRLTDVNQAFLDMTGFSREEALDKSWRDLTPPEFVPASENAVQEIRSRGETTPYEKQYYRKDGSRWWGLFAGRKLGDEVVEYVLDITKRREAEDAIRTARDEAEAARGAAEEANRAKSRFLAAASHDLRQPVTAAGLYMGLLENRITDPDQRALVDMISLSLDGLRGMLNGLLEMARLEAGVIEPKLETFALDELLQRLSAEFAGPAAAGNLALDVPQTGCFVHSDALLLELILRNLLSNAIKFTEEGGVSVRCTTSAGWVRIEVADTGQGIEAEQLHRIFEDFAQVGEQNRSLGFGIGLATVRRAAALLGHRVEVDTVPGQGSRFSVTVPADQSVALKSAAEDDSPPDAIAPSRVLVIEDDRMVAAALQMALQSWGLDATVAHSLADGRRAIGKSAFDLVISDFELPDGDGMDACRQTRAPCILLTGNTQPDTLRRAHEARLSVLTKPVEIHTLQKAVRDKLGTALTGRRAGRAAGSD